MARTSALIQQTIMQGKIPKIKERNEARRMSTVPKKRNAVCVRLLIPLNGNSKKIPTSSKKRVLRINGDISFIASNKRLSLLFYQL